MNIVDCPQEEDVSKASRTGQWTVPIKAHLAECSHCREIVLASRWMQALAQFPESDAALPEPGVVWWRAQLIEKQAAAERSQKPLEWVENFTAAVIAIAVAGGFAWGWSQIQGRLPALLETMWPEFWKATWTAATSAPDVYSSLTLPMVIALCIGVILLGYPLLAEE